MKQKELISQMQVNGVDIDPSSLSKLEGQIRMVSDIERKVIAKILHVPVDLLLRE